MIKSVFVFFALCLSLQGCSMMKDANVKDIPQRPIVEEQDTPFVFKEAYQQQGLYSTQTRVVNDNDFVDIEPSMQYVWWTPTAAMDIYKPTSNSKNEADNSANTTPILSNDIKQACATIICSDSSEVCGSIAICDGKICDESKENEYSCMLDSCETVKALHKIEVAKGETQCAHYPERDICPQMTACKSSSSKGLSKVTMKQATRLLWEEAIHE